MGTPDTLHGTGPASAWVERWAPLLPAGAQVLDLACGAGRHALRLAARGCRVTAIDRDSQALAWLQGRAQADGLSERMEVITADVEGAPWPLPGRKFDAIVITHYLWRPLWPVLLDSLAPQGCLLVETFALGHERLGRPSNPNFLLRPGELLEVARDLQVLAYEDGLLDSPPRRIQRIVAIAPGPAAEGAAGSAPPFAWPLEPATQPAPPPTPHLAPHRGAGR